MELNYGSRHQHLYIYGTVSGERTLRVSRKRQQVIDENILLIWPEVKWGHRGSRGETLRILKMLNDPVSGAPCTHTVELRTRASSQFIYAMTAPARIRDEHLRSRDEFGWNVLRFSRCFRPQLQEKSRERV